MWRSLFGKNRYESGNRSHVFTVTRKENYLRFVRGQIKKDDMTDDIDDRIAVKQKQVEVENDPEKKERYRKQLMVLRLRKEIASIQQQQKN